MRSARRVAVVLSIAVLGLLPGRAAGHEDAASHAAEDSVPLSHLAAETRLQRTTNRLTARDAAAAAAAVTGTEGDVGQWGPVVDWPVVGVHVALLPNGKVLAYDSVGDNATETYPLQNFTRATVWDPATGTQTPVNVDTGFNIFCSGLAHLTDGSIFVAGGNKDQQLNGIVQTHTFNPATNTWSLGPNMAAGRWYPSVTPLRNGEMLITEGGPDVPEVRTTAGGLRSLSTASLNLPLYPWIDVAPDGRAFYSGPDQTMRSLDTTGTGAWQAYAQRDALNRSYGSHAFYDVGKILVAGGGSSTNDARVIDLNGATPQVSATAPMAYGRRQHNLTVLADGSVLATGGNSSGASLVDLNNGVYAAELWNPATGQWKTLSAMQVTRQYHSTALLLPDGRVLSAGGGICGTCDTVGYLAKNAEVFTPPYLFKQDGSGELAPRPTIDSAPAEVTYNLPFAVGTADAASIRKLALIRLGAVTHSVNMEQRYIPLSFTTGTGTLTATAPRDANIAPPGVYMLVAVDASGVPSVAKMVTVKGNVPPSAALTQPADGATFTAPAAVSIAANAGDSDGTVAKVEFFNGATKLGEDTTAPYTFDWTGVGAGSYTLTARATDDLGATTTSAPRTITVTSPSAPPTVSITSPAAGSTFAWHGDVNIAATASASAGASIQKVEFLRDGTTTPLGQDTTAPYTYRWKNPASGSYVLRARATDSRGAVTTSAGVAITVRAR
jgi:hypothetical protein